MGEGALTVPTIMMEELVQSFDASSMQRIGTAEDKEVAQR
jgi:hypothetical protein